MDLPVLRRVLHFEDGVRELCRRGCVEVDLAKERQAFDSVTTDEDLTSLGDLLDEATK